jgi:hypothetical protein
MSTWDVVGYVALALVAIAIIVNIKDIKRYIRIRTM